MRIAPIYSTPTTSLPANGVEETSLAQPLAPLVQSSLPLRWGYGVLAMNLALLGMASWLHKGINLDEPLPVLLAIGGYLVTQIYGIIILRGPRRSQSMGMLYLANLYACCFTLDVSTNLFADYSVWWSIACALTLATVALEPLAQRWTGIGHRVYLLAVGLASAVLLHQALFFMASPFTYAIGGMALVLLGFGVLLFVPAILLVGLGLQLARQHFRHSTARWYFAGLALPLTVFGVLATAYLLRVSQIKSLAASPSELPASIHLLEGLRPDYLSRVALLGPSTLQTRVNENWSNSRLLHDPIGFWLLALADAPAPEDAVAINHFIQFFDASTHGLEEQLWRGMLVTTPIVDLRHLVNPATRTVRTRLDIVAVADASARAPQEAIYTFHLPEGAVVTGSSLWLNGVEQPGRLTTKARAERAYRTVVGVERRDPMLVQWRDGQTVSVRVFPVTKDLPRTFSLEVLAPLGVTTADDAASAGEPVVQPIMIEGPGLTWAESAEDVLVERGDASALLFDAKIHEAATPLPRRHLYRAKAHVLDAERLEIKLDRPAEFVHAGVRYRLETARPVYARAEVGTPGSPNAVYLDLTAGWTAEDVETIRKAAQPLPLRGLTSEGWRPLQRQVDTEQALACAKTRPRSLLPLYKIPYPAGAILITRDQTQPLTLDLISGSETRQRLDAFTGELPIGTKLSVFHLGEKLPPYLESQAAVGVVSAEIGKLSTLVERLRTGERRRVADGPGIIEYAGGTQRITALPTELADSDGDPALLQLFAARQAMLASQGDSLSEAAQEARITIARTANVVSPFSSLIVLETNADYARFGIENLVGLRREVPPAAGLPKVVPPSISVAEPALLNQVFVSGEGSVPEPEEWALILLGMLTAVWVFLRRSPLF